MLLWAIIFLVLWLVSVVFYWVKWPEAPPWGIAVLLMLGILGWFQFGAVFAGK